MNNPVFLPDLQCYLTRIFIRYISWWSKFFSLYTDNYSTIEPPIQLMQSRSSKPFQPGMVAFKIWTIGSTRTCRIICGRLRHAVTCFFVKYFSLKKASKFPVFIKEFPYFWWVLIMHPGAWGRVPCGSFCPQSSAGVHDERDHGYRHLVIREYTIQFRNSRFVVNIRLLLS